AVHGGAGEEGVAEEWRPLLDGPVRGEDGRAALIALSDDLVEVDRLVVDKRPEAEVVDDEEVGRGEAGHPAVERAVGPRGPELGQHVVGADVEHVMAGPAGSVAERLRDVRLADARPTDQEDVLAAV